MLYSLAGFFWVFFKNQFSLFFRCCPGPSLGVYYHICIYLSPYIQEQLELLTIMFQGSELYHFKATALSVSSCVISTQFTVRLKSISSNFNSPWLLFTLQIFITNSPLTTTAEHCLSIATAAVFGIVTFVIYLWHKFHYTHWTHLD